MKISLQEEGIDKEINLYTKEGLACLSHLWVKAAAAQRIMYEPRWLGIPIIQFSEDIIAMQELIWRVKPDVVIETGVAHGGTAIFYASMLELLGKGKVIGIDIDIRKHNEEAIRNHVLSKRIHLIQGSSIDSDVVKQAASLIKETDTVLVTLDSNHSYAHVLQELTLYAPLVSENSYLVAMDGAQEWVWDIPTGKKEWKQDNPLRAIQEFLRLNPEWQVDHHYNRFMITSNPSGFLHRKPRSAE